MTTETARATPTLAATLRDRLTVMAPGLALILGGLVIWELLSRFEVVPPYLLPGPVAILTELLGDFPTYLDASVPTVGAILAGFALAVLISLPLAVGMVYSKLLQRAVFPLVLISQIVPKVAIAPLFIVWFGFGVLPKVFMVVLISFFPMVVDSLVGFAAARPESLMLVRSMGASKWQAFWKVRFPWALPSVFAGAKVAITLAVVGAVVAEFVGADRGLGVLITQARGNLDTVRVFAGIAMLSLIGVVMFGLVALLERLLVHGRRSSRGFEAAGTL